MKERVHCLNLLLQSASYHLLTHGEMVNWYWSCFVPLKVYPRNLLSIRAIKRLFDRMEDTEKAGRDRVVILKVCHFNSPFAPCWALCLPAFLSAVHLSTFSAIGASRCLHKQVEKARDTGKVDLNCLIVKFLTRRLRAYVVLYFSHLESNNAFAQNQYLDHQSYTTR